MKNAFSGKRRRLVLQILGAYLTLALPAFSWAQNVDPLPSWNDTAPKKAILAFVEKVTKEGSPDFVAAADRIATFDNDGTLWCEQPIYFQGLFVFDRIKALAPEHSEWKEKEPFASVLKGDLKGALVGGEKALAALVETTHAGMTVDQFARAVAEWLATARHPKFNRPYTELVYQPMLELLAYLRANGFKTFIVSGGGAEFIRVFAEKAYGIPPEQVVGSTIKMKFELLNGKPEIARLPKIDFIDDGPGKPVGIAKFIGRRPIMAFGSEQESKFFFLRPSGTGLELADSSAKSNRNPSIKVWEANRRIILL